MSPGTLLMFALYLVAMLAIGVVLVRRTRTLGDYLLGGRQLNTWVTALSAQASDMSGWLLMGLPGAIYLSGLAETWMVLGLWVGTWINWRVVAPRLRVMTEQLDAITLPTFFEARFGPSRTSALSLVSAVAIIFFFTIYAAAGLVAAGLLFEAVLLVRYETAVWLGAGVILGYTAVGGFLAVAWTDLVQGLLILVAMLAVPVVAWIHLGDATEPLPVEAAARLARGIWPHGLGLGLGSVAILSSLAWGLGYFGQPHILVRFMAARSERDLPTSRRIAMTWVTLSLLGAVAAGWIGIAIYPGGLDEPERVFIRLVADLFDPWLGGVLLAAILAAIMSTIDSQLLVSASAVSEDVYARLFRRRASQAELVWVGRVAVAAVTLVAAALAMDRESTVLGLVKYAWGGLGASFGPLVLFALLSRRVTYAAALAGLLVGAGTTVLWKELGLGATVYELLPGFAAGCLAIFVTSRLGGGAPGAAAGTDQSSDRS